jgi:hypothetical protein
MEEKLMGMNPPLALAIRDNLGIDTFIETGTWRANTSVWAAQNFKEVRTLEGMPGRFYKSWSTYHTQYPNIMFQLGDSKTLLAQHMACLQVPALFWLDAHYCSSNEEEAGAGIVKCPVMHELLAINGHKLAHLHAIMVDDARLFGVESGWPRPDVLLSELGKFGRNVALYEDVYYGLPQGCGVTIP